MAELKAQNNIRVLVHHDRRIVYQIDCVGGTGTVEVLPLFPGMVLQFLSFRCKSFHPSEIKEMGDCLKINYWELLYKGWFTLPTTLHRLTVHLWQSENQQRERSHILNGAWHAGRCHAPFFSSQQMEIKTEMYRSYNQTKLNRTLCR